VAEERVLIARFCAGDAEAAQEICNRLYRPVLDAAFWRFSSYGRDSVYDAMHEAWMRLLDNPGQFLSSNLSSIRAWLLRTAENYLKDVAKSAASRSEVSPTSLTRSLGDHDGDAIRDDMDLFQAPTDVSEEACRNIDGAMLASVVGEALSELEAITAAAISARIDGKSIRETAKELGLSYDATKKRVQRGRRELICRLRRHLEREGESDLGHYGRT